MASRPIFALPQSVPPIQTGDIQRVLLGIPTDIQVKATATATKPQAAAYETETLGAFRREFDQQTQQRLYAGLSPDRPETFFRMLAEVDRHLTFITDNQIYLAKIPESNAVNLGDLEDIRRINAANSEQLANWRALYRELTEVTQKVLSCPADRPFAGSVIHDAQLAMQDRTTIDREQYARGNPLLGTDRIQREIADFFLYPLENDEQPTGTSRGFLLYGPEGVGKTMLAQDAARTIAMRLRADAARANAQFAAVPTENFVKQIVAPCDDLRDNGNASVDQIITTLSYWLECATFGAKSLISGSPKHQYAVMVLDGFDKLFLSNPALGLVEQDYVSPELRAANQQIGYYAGTTQSALLYNTAADSRAEALTSVQNRTFTSAPTVPTGPADLAAQVAALQSRLDRLSSAQPKSGGHAAGSGGDRDRKTAFPASKTAGAARIGDVEFNNELAKRLIKLFETGPRNVLLVYTVRKPWDIPDLLIKRSTKSSQALGDSAVIAKHQFVDLPSDQLRQALIVANWERHWLLDWANRVYTFSKTSSDVQVRFNILETQYQYRSVEERLILLAGSAIIDKLESGEFKSRPAMNGSDKLAFVQQMFRRILYARRRFDANKLATKPADQRSEQDAQDIVLATHPLSSPIQVVYRLAVEKYLKKVLDPLVNTTGMGPSGVCALERIGIPVELLQTWLRETGRWQGIQSGMFGVGLNVHELYAFLQLLAKEQSDRVKRAYFEEQKKYLKGSETWFAKDCQEAARAAYLDSKTIARPGDTCKGELDIKDMDIFKRFAFHEWEESDRLVAVIKMTPRVSPKTHYAQFIRFIIIGDHNAAGVMMAPAPYCQFLKSIQQQQSSLGQATGGPAGGLVFILPANAPAASQTGPSSNLLTLNPLSSSWGPAPPPAAVDNGYPTVTAIEPNGNSTVVTPYSGEARSGGVHGRRTRTGGFKRLFDDVRSMLRRKQAARVIRDAVQAHWAKLSKSKQYRFIRALESAQREFLNGSRRSRVTGRALDLVAAVVNFK